MLAGLKVPSAVLKVVFPCSGAMLSSKVFETAFGLQVENLGTWDIERKYAKVLREVVPPEVLHFGPIDGDITKVTLESLQIPHYMIGAPPCPHWAGNGGHSSNEDTRADVNETFLKWIKHCADSSEEFIGFALENVDVGGINSERYDGLSFFVDVVVSHMQKEF